MVGIRVGITLRELLERADVTEDDIIYVLYYRKGTVITFDMTPGVEFTLDDRSWELAELDRRIRCIEVDLNSDQVALPISRNINR